MYFSILDENPRLSHSKNTFWPQCILIGDLGLGVNTQNPTLISPYRKSSLGINFRQFEKLKVKIYKTGPIFILTGRIRDGFPMEFLSDNQS